MTAEPPQVEPLGHHEYLVRVPDGDDIIEIRMHASPAVVQRLEVGDSEGIRVIEATVAYLLGRQRADDLPPEVELDDVAAAYDGYLYAIRRQLNP